MKTKIKVKKRVKKRKRKSSWLVKFFTFMLIFFALIWLFFELTKPRVATEWVDRRATHKQYINLPKDDGFHANRMEWWYYNGHLVSESGREYSFHFVTFLVNDLMTHTVFHSALADHAKSQYHTDQSRAGGNPSAAIENGFDFQYGHWLMQGSEGHDRLKVENNQFAFDLQLNSTQAVVYHGQDGIISLGIAGSSYYYSRTRMAITGKLQVDGRDETVKGRAWFDHQWGTL